MTCETELRELLEAYRRGGGFSAAAVAVAAGGEPALELVLGELEAFDGSSAELPADERRPVTTDTYFDLASLTKSFSAHTLLALVRSGVLELDRPLAAELPAYDDGEKRAVTLRHLLTHTSGLPPTWNGWRGPLAELRAQLPEDAAPFGASPLTDRPALIDALLRTPIEAPPGTRFAYACTGFNTAMALAEAVTGEAWPNLVASRTLGPLGLTDEVTFTPDVARTAATEIEDDIGRGLVRGRVHDETAWALGGSCANAGLFGTVRGVLAYFEAIRAGADEITGDGLWRNQLPRVLGVERQGEGDAAFGQSLGLRIGELDVMGVRGGAARGHTGFTGTSVQTDREAGLTIVLLTNRVHPHRDGPGIVGLRAAVAELAYDAFGVKARVS